MNAIKALTQFDFYSELEQSPGISLVYFTAAGCSSCRHLKTVLTELVKQSPHISVYSVDAQQDQALVAEYEVFHLPAMFLFYDGHYHAEIHSEARVSKIEQAIHQALEAPAREAP